MSEPFGVGGRPVRESGAGVLGFTLVELLIVMVILVVLAGIAVPLYVGQKDKAVSAAAKADVTAAARILSAAYATGQQVDLSGTTLRLLQQGSASEGDGQSMTTSGALAIWDGSIQVNSFPATVSELSCVEVTMQEQISAYRIDSGFVSSCQSPAPTETSSPPSD